MFPCVPQTWQEVAQTWLVFAGNCWNLNANAFTFMYLLDPVGLSCFFCRVISAPGFVLIESLSPPRTSCQVFPDLGLTHLCLVLCMEAVFPCLIIIWFLQQLLVFVCSSCASGLCIFLTRMFSLPVFWLNDLFIGSVSWFWPESVLDNIHSNRCIGLLSPLVI